MSSVCTSELLRLIDDYGNLKISRKRLYANMEFAQYASPKLRTRIHAAEEFRARKISERNLEVMYITGASGSGKTTAAKYYANQLGYDYFVSGGGEDILDNYDKEECIILDDFRAGSMRFMEVLKFLDNNTNSSVRSRYNNKDISNCKLLIITSIVAPKQLYLKLQEPGGDEPAEQFYRRLRHRYFVIENGVIAEYSLNKDSISKPTGKKIGVIAEIYKALNIDPNTKEKPSLLDAFTSEYKAARLTLIEEDDIF